MLDKNALPLYRIFTRELVLISRFRQPIPKILA
jgi:hypothetical protein